MNVVIVTARAGSKSILDKNVYMVQGKPLVAYPLQAGLDASRVSRVFCSTDGENIANATTDLGCEVIWRPQELCGDHVNHGEVIKHAVEWVDAKYPDLENVTLLLGNTVFRAVTAAMAFTLIVAAINPRTRIGPRRLLAALVSATRSSVTLIAAAACVGVVLGVVTLTGAGN